MSNRAWKIPGGAGFTLIELLVVLAIIGILAALGITNYQAHRERAKVARTAQELKTFGVAFQAYEMSVGAYPPDTNNLLPPGMEDFITPNSYHTDNPRWGEI